MILAQKQIDVNGFSADNFSYEFPGKEYAEICPAPRRVPFGLFPGYCTVLGIIRRTGGLDAC